jgi:anion-transporting  ArsA/GET3 family ATPase
MSATNMTAPPKALLQDPTTKVLICCGSGGVGKTTSSAAIALHAAELGRKVVVLTIDPAKRLAQALGVAELDNTAKPVPLPKSVPGELFALMLDMRQTFDDMVLSNASAERAQTILANPVYQTMVTSFSGTQEYMAMEKLSQLLADKRWDLIVVDTPPSRTALDFLDAPKRMGAFLDGKLIRLLTKQGRGVGRVVSGVFSVALRGISLVIGSQTLHDVSAFVQSVDTVFGGFRERAERTYRLLSRPGTAFIVVTTAESDSLREAAFFVDRLTAEQLPLSCLLVNRTHPPISALSAAQSAQAAGHFDDGPPEPGARLAKAVLQAHLERLEIGSTELRHLRAFTHGHPDVRVIGVPTLPFGANDLDGLRNLAEQITAD